MRQSVTIFLLFIYLVPAVFSSGSFGISAGKNESARVSLIETNKENGCATNKNIPPSPVKLPVKVKAFSYANSFVTAIPVSAVYTAGPDAVSIKFVPANCMKSPAPNNGNIWQPPRSC